MVAPRIDDEYIAWGGADVPHLRATCQSAQYRRYGKRSLFYLSTYEEYAPAETGSRSTDTSGITQLRSGKGY
jgi:hypothetical protein